MNIFVVDDEPDILRLYSLYLNMRNYNVTATSNSVEALKILSEIKFDLVITDKRMPEVTGLEIIKFVEENTPSTPILLITGDHDINQSFVHSLSKVIHKPIFRESFNDELDFIQNYIFNNTSEHNPG